MAKKRAVRRNGRDKAKEQMWREVLQEYRRSRQSVRAFCRERGLKEASFYRWRKAIGQRDAEAAQVEASLAPVVVVEERGNESSYSGPAAIEIVLCSGTTVRVLNNSTSEQLGMVLDALGRVRC